MKATSIYFLISPILSTSSSQIPCISSFIWNTYLPISLSSCHISLPYLFCLTSTFANSSYIINTPLFEIPWSCSFLPPPFPSLTLSFLIFVVKRLSPLWLFFPMFNLWFYEVLFFSPYSSTFKVSKFFTLIQLVFYLKFAFQSVFFHIIVLYRSFILSYDRLIHNDRWWIEIYKSERDTSPRFHFFLVTTDLEGESWCNGIRLLHYDFRFHRLKIWKQRLCTQGYGCLYITLSKPDSGRILMHWGPLNNNG